MTEIFLLSSRRSQHHQKKNFPIKLIVAIVEESLWTLRRERRTERRRLAMTRKQLKEKAPETCEAKCNDIEEKSLNCHFWKERTRVDVRSSLNTGRCRSYVLFEGIRTTIVSNFMPPPSCSP